MEDKNQNSDVMARLDERTRSIQSLLENLAITMKETRIELNERIVKVENDLIKRMENLENMSNKTFINHQQFDPIEKLVYGVVGLILVTVIGAIIKTVLIP